MKIILALLALAFSSHASTLHIAVGDFGGDGSRDNPLRVQTAAMFDAVLERAASGDYTSIQLGEGVFETRGLWAFPVDRRVLATEFTTFIRPISIRGAGMYLTTIRLSSDATTRANGVDRADLCVMRFGTPWRNNGGPYVVEDLTVDGNEAAFSSSRFVAGGLVFHSNNVTTRNVRVIGLRGTFGPPSVEAFGILINNFKDGEYAGPDGNNRIIDCLMESNGDTQDYVSPFYIGATDQGRPLSLSEIIGCRTVGTGKKPTRIGVSLQSAVVIERFSADNVVHAIYNDVGTIRDAVVRNSRFTRVNYSGPFIIVDARKERVLIERCEFEFVPSSEIWIGLTVWDKYDSKQPAQDIVVRDCVFRGTNSVAFTPLSIKPVGLGVSFVNNRIPANSKVPTVQAGVDYSGNLFR